MKKTQNLEYFIEVLIKLVENGEEHNKQRIDDFKAKLEKDIQDILLHHKDDIEDIKITLGKQEKQISDINKKLNNNDINIAIDKVKMSVKTKVLFAISSILIAVSPIIIKFSDRIYNFILKILKFV